MAQMCNSLCMMLDISSLGVETLKNLFLKLICSFVFLFLIRVRLMLVLGRLQLNVWDL